jgi:hypothetical protein
MFNASKIIAKLQGLSNSYNCLVDNRNKTFAFRVNERDRADFYRCISRRDESALRLLIKKAGGKMTESQDHVTFIFNKHGAETLQAVLFELEALEEQFVDLSNAAHSRLDSLLLGEARDPRLCEAALQKKLSAMGPVLSRGIEEIQKAL